MISKTLPIYLVSLEQDTERRNQLKKSFPETYTSFTHINAVDGRKLTAKEYYDKTISFFFKNKRIMSPAELGCTLSHIEALNQFLKTKHAFALILEDDVIGNDADIAQVNTMVEKLNEDSLLLCGAQESQCTKKYQFGTEISKGLYEVSNFSYAFVYSTCCYVVSRKSAKQILDYHAKNLTLADKWDDFFLHTDIKIYYSKILAHPIDLQNSHIEESRALYQRSILEKVFSTDLLTKSLYRLRIAVVACYYRAIGLSNLP